jgi:hypothetical protein
MEDKMAQENTVKTKSFGSGNIVSISSATGWSAVFMSEDKTVFKVPLACWALIKDWDSCEWIPEIGTSSIIGMCQDPDMHTLVPAAVLERVADEEHQHENPAKFCGYLSPDDKLTDDEWEPVWYR